MKTIMVILMLCSIILPGCAHNMQGDDVAKKYSITYATKFDNIILDGLPENSNSIDVVLNHSIRKLNKKLKTDGFVDDRYPVNVVIETEYYGHKLKTPIPNVRFWVKYQVHIIDGKDSTEYNICENEDGQSDVSDLIEEIYLNTYKCTIKTLDKKLDD